MVGAVNEIAEAVLDTLCTVPEERIKNHSRYGGDDASTESILACKHDIVRMVSTAYVGLCARVPPPSGPRPDTIDNRKNTPAHISNYPNHQHCN